MVDVITMYSMSGCGFCNKAKQLFAAEIGSGKMVVKSTRDAPKGVSGFPHFTYNGKQYTGYPGSKQNLYDAVGYVVTENYNCPHSAKYKNLDHVWAQEGYNRPHSAKYKNLDHVWAQENYPGRNVGFPSGKYATLSQVWDKQSKYQL